MTKSSPSLAVWEPGNHYTQVCCRRINGRQAVAWFSTELEDCLWDDFLETTPLGQYQQSSLWARAKGLEGWRPLRVILTLEGQMAGGFQILARDTRFGSVGYVSKGPVVVNEEAALLDFMMELVISTVKAGRLAALILQPPDQSAIESSVLARHRFFPNHLVGVNTATLIVDTACSLEDIMGRMRRTTMLELKRAKKRGIIMREGGEQDISTFYRLMTVTCQRQQTSPSPATESALRGIWKAFHSDGRIRLSLAECEAQAVAGAICLCFGERVTFWKKGWSGEHRERHPNQMVMFDAIQWSQQQGYRLFDCAAMNRGTAVAMLNGAPLSDEQKRGRDFFLLGYGGTPTLLPESHIYISNPVFRFFCQSTLFTRWSQKLAKTIAAQGV